MGYQKCDADGTVTDDVKVLCDKKIFLKDTDVENPKRAKDCFCDVARTKQTTAAGELCLVEEVLKARCPSNKDGSNWQTITQVDSNFNTFPCACAIADTGVDEPADPVVKLPDNSKKCNSETG